MNKEDQDFVYTGNAVPWPYQPIPASFLTQQESQQDNTKEN